jgi:hypothetical protein
MSQLFFITLSFYCNKRARRLAGVYRARNRHFPLSDSPGRATVALSCAMRALLESQQTQEFPSAQFEGVFINQTVFVQ